MLEYIIHIIRRVVCIRKFPKTKTENIGFGIFFLFLFYNKICCHLRFPIFFLYIIHKKTFYVNASYFRIINPD